MVTARVQIAEVELESAGACQLGDAVLLITHQFSDMGDPMLSRLTVSDGHFHQRITGTDRMHSDRENGSLARASVHQFTYHRSVSFLVSALNLSQSLIPGSMSAATYGYSRSLLRGLSW